ncbi:MAG: DnaD domain protein [Anaerolineales bacterium]|nr:DnaD domain protein [Anaerolineales bacterium]
MNFSGFSAKENFTQLPETFFRELLTQIDDLNELKVVLYALWYMANTEGTAHPLWERDFVEGLDAAEISAGLEKCVRRGSLLRVRLDAEDVYFLNSPRGRAAAESARDGSWFPSKRNTSPPPARPNIYQLYEENIGPLTPLIADSLKDAEEEYPEKVLENAFAQAVKANARNWRYVEAILKRWKEEGYGKKQNRRNDQEDRDRYVQGDYADYLD